MGPRADRYTWSSNQSLYKWPKMAECFFPFLVPKETMGKTLADHVTVLVPNSLAGVNSGEFVNGYPSETFFGKFVPP